MSRPYWGAYFVVLIIIGFFAGLFPLSAQTPEPLIEISGFDESAILLDNAPAAPISNGGSSVSVMLRMVLVLALAALAIYGVFFFIKRLARPRESQDPHLKVLARVPLGSDSFAAVVSVGPKAWLVGGGSGSLNLISEIDDAESLETMLLDDARRTAGTRRPFDFRSLLGKLPGLSQDGKAGPPGSSQVENLRKQRERLTRL